MFVDCDMKNCALCTATGKCSMCLPGYRAGSNNKCELHYDDGKYYDSENGQCSGRKPFLYHFNNFFFVDCNLAMENRNACDNSETCTQCLSPYILGENDKCELDRNTVMEPCSTCEDSEACIQCSPSIILEFNI